MAEDLSEFLFRQQDLASGGKEKSGGAGPLPDRQAGGFAGKIAVQYLHSGVDISDRITILSDLRRGKYDVLVGVNLLAKDSIFQKLHLLRFSMQTKKDFCVQKLRLFKPLVAPHDM